MNFNIDAAPPGQDILEQERKLLSSEINRLTLRDTMLTFFIIIICSAILGLIIFWQTDNLKYTGISIAVFPVIGTILSLLGITKSTGFRSAANRITEFQNELIELSPVPNSSRKDIDTLTKRHILVNEYHEKIVALDRETTNAELAMFWEFDSSTMANTARGRDLVNKAKDRIVRE